MDKNLIKQKVKEIHNKTELFAIPIQIVSVANYYGFAVFELSMPDSNNSMILVNEDEVEEFGINKVIIINAGLSTEKKRFAIAKELAHYFIKDEPVCFGHYDNGQYDEDEKYANRFAMELLMPREDILGFLESFGDLSTASADALISIVAKRYSVTEDVAKIRLILLSQEAACPVNINVTKVKKHISSFDFEEEFEEI